MFAQHFAQRFLKQMGRGVVAADRHAAGLVDCGSDGIAGSDGAVQQLTGMDKVTLRGLFDLGDFQFGASGRDHAVVGHLAAHLGIEGRVVQHHQNAAFGLPGRVRRNGCLLYTSRCV